MKYAVIDIGSNSVRLMLWADGKTLYKKVETTRLGEGLDLCGSLSPAACERTARAVSDFCREGEAAGARVSAFATAAVRGAANRAAFLARVRELCGLTVDVVSGTEEADLARLGALGTADGGVVDIGGASTEICFRKGGETVYSHSFDVGAVRLHDACGEDRDKLFARIARSLKGLCGEDCGTVYAVGGTASTLAAVKAGLDVYSAEVLQDLALERRWVGEIAETLFSMTVEERRAVRGMDPKRADVIAGAALLLYEIMSRLSLAEVKFSDRDNLEGYLLLRGLV